VEQCCSSCSLWQRFIGYEFQDEDTGICRRYPTKHGERWIVRHKNAYCGEWRGSKNSIEPEKRFNKLILSAGI